MCFLLHPLDPQRSLAILPAVDPAGKLTVLRRRGGSSIFSEARWPEAVCAAGRSFLCQLSCGRAGEAGLLATLDMPNNFPQLPIWTDGPYLV